MVKKILASGLVAVFAAVAMGLVQAQSQAHQQSLHTARQETLHLSSRVPNLATVAAGRTVVAYIPGVPAITPSIARYIQASITDPHPAYTAADAAQYVDSHPQFVPNMGGPPMAGKVVSVRFITAAQASALMRGEWIGRPDNAIVCFVVIAGMPNPASGDVHHLTTFDLTAIAGHPRAVETSIPASEQMTAAVFDAHTGNILLLGGTTA